MKTPEDPALYHTEPEIGELPPPEFGSDFLPECFAELACDLLGVTVPDLVSRTGERALHLRKFAGERTGKRVNAGKLPLRRDLDCLPGGSLLAYADALEKTPHGAVSSKVAILLRQSAVMLAQDYLLDEELL